MFAGIEAVEAAAVTTMFAAASPELAAAAVKVVVPQPVVVGAVLEQVVPVAHRVQLGNVILILSAAAITFEIPKVNVTEVGELVYGVPSVSPCVKAGTRAVDVGNETGGKLPVTKVAEIMRSARFA